MQQSEANPIGRDEVIAALKAATLDLLAEQGTHFSVREVASRAGVNHGLVHRHFGSKASLISEAANDMGINLELQLRQGTPPLELVAAQRSTASRILGRLLLEDQAHLVREHPTVAALVEQASSAPSASPLTAEERAGLATALSLGWSLFGEFALRAAQTVPSQRVADELDAIIEGLVGAPTAMTNSEGAALGETG